MKKNYQIRRNLFKYRESWSNLLSLNNSSELLKNSSFFDHENKLANPNLEKEA